jgi:hypothetical protein
MLTMNDTSAHILLRERVIAVYARRGAQNAESLLEYSNKFYTWANQEI